MTSSTASATARHHRFVMPARRVVHLDLKGAPPKIDYLKLLPPLLRTAGATTLLIEYEDIFPYEGPLAEIAAANAYTSEDVANLLACARANELEVIPLVQTFGHLEHVLKLESFADLREDPAYPEALCPSRNGSIALVRQMLDQVMRVHAGARFVHIGCDEVFHLATCGQCRERLSRLQRRTVPAAAAHRTLFLDHVRSVAEYLREQHGVTALMWDDMLRSVPPEEILAAGLGGGLVEPVVWAYGEDVDRLLGGATVWQRYASVFPSVWAASAFKGAFGEHLQLPDLNRHLRNQVAWLEVMRRETVAARRPDFFRGLVLTGWSRYDHFAVLCELLPVALPSLMLDLAAVVHPNSADARQNVLKRTLNCPHDLDVRSLSVRPGDARWAPVQLHKCSFPGAMVLGSVWALEELKSDQQVDSLLRLGGFGWLTDYHLKHNFTSAWRLRRPKEVLMESAEAVSEVERAARETMARIFDQYTVRSCPR